MKRCARCKEPMRPREAFDWIDDNGKRSKRYCSDCYEWIVDRYEQGVDLDSLLKGDD